VNRMKRVRLLAGLVVAICIAIAPARAQTSTESVLYSFCPTPSCVTGSGLFVGVVQGSDGNFYGTATWGGTGAFSEGYCSSNSCGTVYQLTPSGQIKVLYNFCNQSYCSDGEEPGPLIQGSDGSFYGTADGGNSDECPGDGGCGVVFKVTRSGAYSVLYAFCSQSNCPDGDGPYGLTQGADGNFYGLTSDGGANGLGTIFKLTPTGALKTLYNLCSVGGSSCTDGEEPSVLVQGSDGNFYGEMYSGGANGKGTIFKFAPTGVLTTIYNFCSVGGRNCTDGLDPAGGLIEGADGNLYGASSEGPNELGQIFKITTAGSLTPICTDCYSDLVLASDGNFYGPGYGPTSVNSGFVKVTPTGTLTTLYTFCSQTDCVDGEDPNPGVIQGSDGDFYGTTLSGGANGGPYPYGCDGSPQCGTIYEIAIAPALPVPVQL
jgi:uncharacterized repeat protein (TIGR03803 family)